MLLEAWGADNAYHTLASRHVLRANVWYTIAASSRALPDSGGFLWELRLNGKRSGSTIVRVGGLAVLLLVGWFLYSSRAQEPTAASAGSGGQGQRRSRDIMCERGQSFKA